MGFLIDLLGFLFPDEGIFIKEVDNHIDLAVGVRVMVRMTQERRGVDLNNSETLFSDFTLFKRQACYLILLALEEITIKSKLICFQKWQLLPRER